jgi:hypothetical protein
MVIRKMISITSMTSTSGVVLMLDITGMPLPPPPEGMLIDMIAYSSLATLERVALGLTG